MNMRKNNELSGIKILPVPNISPKSDKKCSKDPMVHTNRRQMKSESSIVIFYANLLSVLMQDAIRKIHKLFSEITSECSKS